MVRAAGYRTHGGESHHFVTFEVAGSLVTDAELRRALDTMNSLRKVRHSVEYEADDDVDEPTVATACQVADQVISLGAQHLRDDRPALMIPDPSGPGF